LKLFFPLFAFFVWLSFDDNNFNQKKATAVKRHITLLFFKQKILTLENFQ